MTLLSSVSDSGRAASARSMVEPQPPTRALIAPFADSLPSCDRALGRLREPPSTIVATASTPLPTSVSSFSTV